MVSPCKSLNILLSFPLLVSKLLFGWKFFGSRKCNKKLSFKILVFVNTRTYNSCSFQFCPSDKVNLCKCLILYSMIIKWINLKLYMWYILYTMHRLRNWGLKFSVIIWRTSDTDPSNACENYSRSSPNTKLIQPDPQTPENGHTEENSVKTLECFPHHWTMAADVCFILFLR